MKGGLREKRGGGKAVLTKQTGFRTSSTQKERERDDPSYQSKTRREKAKKKKMLGCPNLSKGRI